MGCYNPTPLKESRPENQDGRLLMEESRSPIKSGRKQSHHRRSMLMVKAVGDKEQRGLLRGNICIGVCLTGNLSKFKWGITSCSNSDGIGCLIMIDETGLWSSTFCSLLTFSSSRSSFNDYPLGNFRRKTY